jgi:hypothetical protein
MNTNYRIFVTSDFRLIEIDAANHFPKDTVIYTTGMSENNEANHFLKIKNCQENLKFMLDFFLLSNCDHAVIGHGEYGQTALYNRDYPKSKVWKSLNDSMPEDFYSNHI